MLPSYGTGTTICTATPHALFFFTHLLLSPSTPSASTHLPFPQSLINSSHLAVLDLLGALKERRRAGPLQAHQAVRGGQPVALAHTQRLPRAARPRAQRAPLPEHLPVAQRTRLSGTWGKPQPYPNLS